MAKEDKLKEITNQSAENASKALTKLSGEPVKVEVPKAEITKLGKVFPDLGPETMVAGIYLPVTGEIKGASLLIFPEKIAYTLCDLLVKRKPGTTRQMTELDKSALKEVGNIICGSFLTVFSNTLKIKIIEHIPSFSFDMFGAIIDQIIVQFALKSQEALVIEVKFVFQKTPLKGYVVLFFGLEEMKAIVGALESAE